MRTQMETFFHWLPRLGSGRARAAVALSLVALIFAQPASAQYTVKRIPTQFIAALGDPEAKSGIGAETWGVWKQDPGPRGVWLSLYDILRVTGGYSPSGWWFDKEDWWLDENGLIMEQPEFPVEPGIYLVTGEREVTTLLTIHPIDENGEQHWELANDAKLFDVTHLPCRSARYTPSSGEGSCTPASADIASFPVIPGGDMPAVEGCHKQDYAVMLVLGIVVEE